MNGIFALSLKITNWCDLYCPHCSEDSGRSATFEYMPIDKLEDGISQFQELPLNLSRRITISGGEPMLPYFKKDENYMPAALTLISKADAIPVIKTNGTWGRTYMDRSSILKSLAKNANFVCNPVVLNMPVDEFHNNLSGVANIISDIVFSDYLQNAIYIEVSGFNTIGSVVANARLRTCLKEREISTLDVVNDDIVAYTARGDGIHISVDNVSQIYKLGRAVKNRVYTAEAVMPYVNKIQIDNDDNVSLNRVVSEKINNRPLVDVMDILIPRLNQRQK
ncbi:MAG: hypothetical protein J6T57_04680 [Alphaproteobacteria bacterium]|nr:hypothetical protein [Alphaproteobacteria bacterium]